MTRVTVSPKYQIVIPKEIRKKLDIRCGQKMAVVTRGEWIMLVPDLPLKHYRGFLKGVSSEGVRDRRDRF